MKNAKKILALMVVASTMCFAACDNDDSENTEPKKPIETEKTYDFIGTLEVANGYKQENVELRIGYSDSLKLYVFDIKEVSFSQAMPLIKGVQLAIQNRSVDNGDTLYSAEKIVPCWNNAPIDFMTLYDFKAKVNKDSLTFTSNGGKDSQDGLNAVNYYGKRK